MKKLLLTFFAAAMLVVVAPTKSQAQTTTPTTTVELTFPQYPGSVGWIYCDPSRCTFCITPSDQRFKGRM